MYQLRFYSPVKKDKKKLDKPVLEEIKNQHLAKIIEDPYKGEPLHYHFKGLYSYHFSSHGTQYRIIYEIYPDKNLVLVIMIASRENLYDALKRRLK